MNIHSKDQSIKLFAHIGLLIFFYYLSYYFLTGVTHPIPAPGDSYTYHIPISQSILDGRFLNLSRYTPKLFMGQFNPGSSEAINSLLMLLHIPLTTSVLIAIIALFFSCFFLARTFQLGFYYSLLFAESICTLTAVTRWFNAVSVDAWLAVFFTIAIILFEKPEKTYRYAFVLGVILGMLVGSKYSAWGLLFILFIAYSKTIFRLLSIRRFIVFVIPFSILGIFWYIRNYLAIGNPVWPLCLLSLPCQGPWYSEQMWNVTLKYPLIMLNAFFSEYKLWTLSIFTIFFVLYSKLKKNIILPSKVLMLCLVGIAYFLMFLKFPTAAQPWVMVSSFRYSYPIFIAFILCDFILVKHFKMQAFLGYFVIANMLPILSLPYEPKLIFVYFPIGILCMYMLQKYIPEGDIDKEAVPIILEKTGKRNNHQKQQQYVPKQNASKR